MWTVPTLRSKGDAASSAGPVAIASPYNPLHERQGSGDPHPFPDPRAGARPRREGGMAPEGGPRLHEDARVAEGLHDGLVGRSEHARDAGRPRGFRLRTRPRLAGRVSPHARAAAPP